MSGRSKVIQARGQITLLATCIVAAVMSIVRWLTSSPLLPVGDAPTSAANKEVEKMCSTARREEPTITMMMKFAKY